MSFHVDTDFGPMCHAGVYLPSAVEPSPHNMSRLYAALCSDLPEPMRRAGPAASSEEAETDRDGVEAGGDRQS